MALTPARVRQLYRQFDDPGVYDDFVINTYLSFAVGMLNPSRWGNQLDFATGLFVAHHLTLRARDELTIQAGGLPGAVQAPIASKSVDKVSISFDVGAVSLADEGFWGSTMYGKQLYNLARMFGSGGLQL